MNSNEVHQLRVKINSRNFRIVRHVSISAECSDAEGIQLFLANNQELDVGYEQQMMDGLFVS
jgi:hypothetical protein